MPYSMDPLAANFESQTDARLSPETSYIQSVSLARRKKLGQFFTPLAYANIMADWIAGISPEAVFDPAVGTGLLLDNCRQRGVGRKFSGYDIDSAPMELAKTRMAGTVDCAVDFREGDFLATGWDTCFDAIIANPPYIRCRDYDLNPQVIDDIEWRSGQRLSRQSNLYIYFVIKICEQLAHGGRAAILIPSEWMGANYGQPLKAYLLQRRLLSGLVTIDHAGYAFEDNMATASILLIEKSEKRRSTVDSFYVPQASEPASLAAIKQDANVIRQTLSRDELQSLKKWDMLLRQPAVRRVKGHIRLGELVTTKRGIATGANRYFLLNRQQAEDHGLATTRMTRCVGKTAHTADIFFSQADFERLTDSEQPCFLFNPSANLTPAEIAYIAQGEAAGVALKHGPRTKRIWYAAEERPVAPIWASTFGRGQMRFIYNGAGVKALTCFHNLYAKALDTDEIRALVALLNSDLMQDAVNAHVRVLASGLMKLEPRDILDINIPDIRSIPRDIIRQLADWLCDRPSNSGERDMVALERLTAQVFQLSSN